jgi:methionyl-tRNA formyltransferase
MPHTTNNQTKIVFMGTPEFAVASLDALYTAGFNIAGVITAPDKPGGRGMQLQQSAVKQYAVSKGLHILQPEKLKNPEFLAELKALQADVQVVVAFRMLPELVWNMPPMGTINLHGSLLPQYRGAAPINWAVINGEKQTGVTTFKLQHEIDTGNILLQESFAISDDENVGQIHDRMKDIGASLIVKTIEGLVANTITEQPQPTNDNGQLKHAPKIFTETCTIDWEKDCNSIYNLIRGLSPYPAAFCFLDEKKLKVFAATKEIATHQHITATHFTDGKTFFKYACADGFIHITDLQLEGKKRMKTEDFLRGYRFA